MNIKSSSSFPLLGIVLLSPLSITSCHPTGDARAVTESVASVERSDDTSAQAHYLANAGVLVTDGDTKIAFDPLFRNDYGVFRLVPPAIERSLFAGEPPFDGLDAVFISHYHEDHFSAADIVRLMKALPELELFAPAQAVAGLRGQTGSSDSGNSVDSTNSKTHVFQRVHEIALQYKDAPITIQAGALTVEAVRIPHSGWPERRQDVENIAFRVSLDENTTVLHMGDADTKDEHFARDAEYWARHHTHMAFPPYWYFSSENGREVLEQRIKPSHAVGVHVPLEIANAEERPAELEGYDLFVVPGETREIPR